MRGPGKVAFFAFAAGSSGTGKTPWVRQQLAKAKPKRLIVWDPLGDLDDLGTVFRGIGEMPKLIHHVHQHAKQFAVVFQPGREASKFAVPFDILCKLVYSVGHVTFFADELGDVLKPGWSPDSWSLLVRSGSHQSVRVYGAAQRPTMVDKNFFSGVTLVHCGRLNLENDCKTMAGALSVPWADVSALKADPDTGVFEWIERNLSKGTPAVRGRLKFGA